MLVIYTPEWGAYIHLFTPVPAENITVTTDVYNKKIAKLCNAHGMEYCVIDKILYQVIKGERMKFDVVVGNPPYQDKTGNENSTNSKALYVSFVERAIALSNNYIALVIPSAWSGPKNSSLKTTIFEENQPLVFNTHKTKWFKVEMNTCYFITIKGRKGSTILTDNFNNKICVTLDRTSSIPTDLATLSIQSKIKTFARDTNLAEIWLRGSLHLNQIVEIEKGVEFIAAVGRSNDPFTTVTIDPRDETTGAGAHKVVIPNMASNDSIGNVKIARPDHVGGHSVVFLTTNSQTESENLKEYLESSIVRWIIKSVKISTPNSKTVFSFIPRIDLSRKWTNDELYCYFGLTSEEIKYVKSTTNS